MPSRDVVLCHPVRTAIGTFNGTLKSTPATELGATVVRETLRRAGLDPERVGSVVMGNVIQAGNRMNPARQAAVTGGIPVTVPALTVNRVCGSGAQAIASAAQEVWLGLVDAAVAGGMENMDRAPYLLPSGRWGQRMGNAEIHDSMLRDGLNDAFSGEHSGWHTEDLVTRFKITREDQDRWAERSQKRFAAAQKAGRFAPEIVGIEVNGRKGPQIFDADEANRPETTLETLAKLKPAFRKDGTITAGNAPGLNSGAAAMVVADTGIRRAQSSATDRAPGGLRDRGGRTRHVRYRSGARGPASAGARSLEPARRRAGGDQRGVRGGAACGLARTRLAGRHRQCRGRRHRAWPPDRSHGRGVDHALLHSMRRDGLKRGIVTLCIGGGQGIALALEAL